MDKEKVINKVIIMNTLIIKSLLTSRPAKPFGRALFQREEKSPLERGAGVCNPSLVKEVGEIFQSL
jgi:hypothetical protein